MKTGAILSVILILFIACNHSEGKDKLKKEGQIKEKSISENSSTIALFNRWEKVWHQGQYDLIPECIADKYIRHDQKGDRIVTREDYAKEIQETRKLLPDIQFIVYDNWFSKNKALLRYTMTYTDPETKKLMTKNGIQIYKLNDGKLAETWLILQGPGTKWSDSKALKCWSCSK